MDVQAKAKTNGCIVVAGIIIAAFLSAFAARFGWELAGLLLGGT